jgi:predicted acyl esterase
MVCSRDAAAASRGNSALAGYIRLLSRPHAAGRHLRERISQTLVEPQRPFPETQWTRFFLDAANKTLGPGHPHNMGSLTYPALSAGVTFSTTPWEQNVEIVGPVKAKLFVSSSTRDMDIFATVCAFDPQGEEMTFIAAPEPKSPVTQGWLRVSQRKLDLRRSTEYLPYYPHDERQPLEPGEIYEVDLEIWPMGLALPRGSRLTLTIQGKDFERPGATGPLRGVAWFTHDDPIDRPPELFGGTNTLYTGGQHQSHLLLPILPSRLQVRVPTRSIPPRSVFDLPISHHLKIHSADQFGPVRLSGFRVGQSLLQSARV